MASGNLPFLSRLKAFASRKEGVAAVEFAMLLPVLLLLYLGAFEASQALSANRKVEAVADTVGDLVSRSTEMDATRLSNIMSISAAILNPFPGTGLVMTVTTVKVDANGKATVDWSQANTGPGLRAGSAYTLPTDLQVFTDTYLVFSTVSYPYKALFGYGGIFSNIAMGKTYSFRPRKTAEIPYD
jgi:Flp pilus assembly protein TadG